LAIGYHRDNEGLNEAYPKAGVWEMLDILLQQRTFAIGEIMQAENTSYGITIWRNIGE
jgi:hypothetical protein